MKILRAIVLICIALVVGSTGLVHGGDTEDAITAWKKWKSIDGAIQLRDLDGPEDILEKAEIIEDRADDLEAEKKRLESEIETSEKKLTTLHNQQQMLKDLAEIKLGGDPQTRQRLNDLVERIRREERLLQMRRQSVADLEKELARMKELAAAYHKKARELRIKEGGAQ